MAMKATITCRILIVDTNPQRLAKIAEILREYDGTSSSTFNDTSISLQYLPCLAKFGGYKDEKGQTVKYLASMECLEFQPPVGSSGGETTTSNNNDKSRLRTTSLASVFEDYFQEYQRDSKKKRRNDFVEGIVVGPVSAVLIARPSMGAVETDQVRNLLDTLLSASSSAPPNGEDSLPQEEQQQQQSTDDYSIVWKCLEPNAEFENLTDEWTAYRALEDKSEALKTGSMGPSKVARVANELGHSLKSRIDKVIREKQEQKQQEPNTEVNTIPKEERGTADQQTPRCPEDWDDSKMRYACRKCRRVLFGQDDLQDHEIGQHGFSHRKIRHALGSSTSTSCQSYFLQDVLEWLSSSSSTQDAGKLVCYHCSTKLGGLHWSGAQCSCGTWVVPAIQIPKSKVDTVYPASSSTVADRPSGPATGVASAMRQHV